MACVARYAADGKLYRSEIVSLDDKTARLRFVDYGNEEDIDVNQLLPLYAQLAVFPPLAFLCMATRLFIYILLLVSFRQRLKTKHITS